MLATFRAELKRYAGQPWAVQLLIWSFIAFAIAGVVFWSALGFGNQNGGSGTTGAKVGFFLGLVVAVPATIVFNLLVAVIWALARTAAGAFSE